jgi:hypothetical protein
MYSLFKELVLVEKLETSSRTSHKDAPKRNKID